MTKIQKFAICTAAANPKAPDKVLLFKEGSNRALWADGESLQVVMDAAAGADVISAFRELGRNIVFDYEHQSVASNRQDGKAPAAGWVTEFTYEDGVGLWAHVKWLPAAKAEIESGEYQYFSPVFAVDAKNRVIEVRSVAMTNDPALVDLQPLAASKLAAALMIMGSDKGTRPWKTAGADAMDPLAILLQELGIDPSGFDTPEAALMAAIDKIREGTGDAPAEPSEDVAVAAKALAGTMKAARGAMTSMAAAAKLLKCTADATSITDAVKALQSAKGDQAELVALKAQVNELREANKASARASFLAAGREAGKIVASNQEQWEAIYDADPKRAAELLDKAETLVTTGGTVVSASRTTTASPTDRKGIIAKAVSEYEQQDKATKRIVTSAAAWVNLSLREAGKALLTPTERTEIGA